MTLQLTKLCLLFCGLAAPVAVYQGTYEVLIANVVMASLAWWIQGKAKANDVNAGAWLLASCQLAILLQVLTAQPSLGVHHWLLITTVLPFALLSANQRWLMVALSAINVGLVGVFSLRAEFDHPHAASRIAAETLSALAVAWLGLTARRAADIANKRARHAKALSDSLLDSALPTAIANHLRKRPGSFAFSASDTSILFADLVGFTALTEQIANQQMINLLDELFSEFDDVMQRVGATKIKTIGDAYMATCNVLQVHEDHALRLVVAGRQMCAITRKIGLQHSVDLGLRVAIHSGPLVGGVLGQDGLAFDVWGRTVNTAARLESKAPVDSVLVSDSTRLALLDACKLEPLQAWQLKGIDIPVLTWRVLEAPSLEHIRVGDVQQQQWSLD
ncbi:MAG: hypothetical protein CMH53_05140 [Myxococcales bacterium]|nr:hypothetical protein [Myxococcales bacterium]